MKQTSLQIRRRSTPGGLRALAAFGAIGASTLLSPSLACAADAGSATWPGKPIAYVVPFTPGGSTDVVGRTLAQKLTGELVRKAGARAE